MTRAAILCVCAVVPLVCAPAAAQTRAADGPRFEVGGGVGFFTASDFGSADANLRANDAPASPYRLFSTSTSLESAPFIEAQIGYRMSRQLELDGRFTFGTPELATSLSADAESAASLTATESLDQYLVEVGAAWMFGTLQMGGMVPFVSGGLGYVRQLHEGQALIDQGYDVYLGGGIKQPLLTRTRAKLKSVGVRAEARLRFLAGDVVFDSAVPRFAVSGGVFLGF